MSLSLKSLTIKLVALSALSAIVSCSSDKPSDPGTSVDSSVSSSSCMDCNPIGSYGDNGSSFVDGQSSSTESLSQSCTDCLSSSVGGSSVSSPSSQGKSSSGTSVVNPSSSTGGSSALISSSSAGGISVVASSSSKGGNSVVSPSSSYAESSSSWNPYNPIISYGTFTDTRDGKVYKTVDIEGWVYFAQNLDYGTRVDGSQDQTNDNVVEKYCYNDDPAMCEKYGGYYQWAEAMGLPSACNTNLTGSANCPNTLTPPPGTFGPEARQHQGICPTGWHVANGSEFLNAAPGITFKASSLRSMTADWQGGGGGDNFGFSAVPSGFRTRTTPFFVGSTQYTEWWLADEFNGIGAKRQRIAYSDLNLGQASNQYKTEGRSIRCVKDF